MNLIEETKAEEGFSGVTYKDTLGFDTIGYGTKLPLTKDEAELVLIHRMDAKKSDLNKRLSHLHICQEAWTILYAMSYQLGVNGVIKFKKMVAALEVKDYQEAARQMLDSRWAIQTPARARRMANIMREL